MDGSQVWFAIQPTLKTRTKRIAVVFLLAVVTAILIAFLTQQQRGQVFVLTDGTRITLKVGERGKPLRVFEGQFWQRPFYKLFGTNISWRLRGYADIYQLQDSNAVGVALIRSFTNYEGTPPWAMWNGNVKLAVVGKNGTQTFGDYHVVHFATKQSKGLTKAAAEEIYFEFSALETNTPTLRFVCSNSIVEPSVLEFVVPNKNRK